MPAKTAAVFRLDVDNTLLDNDRIIADLMNYLDRQVGHEREQRYWAIFGQLREELGYADYLGALQRYRMEYPRDPHLLVVSSFLINYVFADRLFLDSLGVVERVKQWGKAVVLTDGDVVFQPRKIERSGLFEAVDGVVQSAFTLPREARSPALLRPRHMTENAMPIGAEIQWRLTPTLSCSPANFDASSPHY